MRLFAILALLVAPAFAQTTPQQPGPWSEQPPLAQNGPNGPYAQQPPPGYGPGQYGRPPDQDGYAPDRGVARVSNMTGNVSVRRGDSGELVAAILNAPLTVGDRVVTGDNGRAEVELDFSSIVRLGPSSEIRLSQLAQRNYQVQIAAGSVIFRVLRDTDAQIEISTPTVAVHPLRRGIYRVNVKPDGSADITVRGNGDAEVVSPAGTEALHNGQMMMTRGAINDPEFQVVAPNPEDDLDHWSASRDRTLLSARSPQYVNRGMYGTEDMDQYGQWQNDPTYGNVWVPQVSPGWAPYQCGRWVWLDFYGWTWMGCEPWAWAPYHYGRWFYGGYGWAWWPGPVVATAFWSPALVGFFGFGAPIGVGVGFGFGFGSIGWVPLAPFEAFHPWYGAGVYGGFSGVRIAAGSNVAGLYRNARVTNAITAMHTGDFGRSSVSGTSLIRPTAMEMAHAGAMRGQLPVGPSRESTQFSNRAVNTTGMPHTSDATRFAGHAAPAVSHVSFAQQQRSFSQAASRGFSSPARGSSAGGGWQRFNPSAGAASRGQAATPYNGARQGTSPYGSRGAAPQQRPVRINPPIIQNRGSAPRSSGAASRGGGGHGGGKH